MIERKTIDSLCQYKNVDIYLKASLPPDDLKKCRPHVTFFRLRLSSLQNMEQKEFKEKVLPLHPRLLDYAERMTTCREEAEDIVQEVLIKLWQLRDELDRYDNLPALATQITKRFCLNRLKHLQMENRVNRELTPHHIGQATPDTHYESTLELHLEQKDRLTHVMRLVDQLPDLQRAVVRMKHVDGLEVEEIAELIGSNPAAIRMNLSRARRAIRDRFMNNE
jgi:RNA polymerase sigma-70 factor (ECF subfamily)